MSDWRPAYPELDGRPDALEPYRLLAGAIEAAWALPRGERLFWLRIAQDRISDASVWDLLTLIEDLHELSVELGERDQAAGDDELEAAA